MLALHRPGSPGTAGRPAPLTGWQRVRTLGNLLNLSTAAGLAVAGLGGCTVHRGPHGLLLAEGYRFAFPVAGAFTVGDVVITRRSFAALLQSRPRLLDHEERHAWQYLCCLGLPYLLPYTLAMGWSMLRTGDRAAANWFERHAGLEAGGYADLPTIPLGVQTRRVVSRLRRSGSRMR